jgi:imidazoleglycerol-phosphate dehydratase
MKERKAEVARKTKETEIALELNLDGAGRGEFATGVGFLDHMIELLAKHASVDLKIKASGDVDVDYHHTVEDVGICLGQALDKALGDKRGIARFADASVPMEDSLAQVSLDLGGRPHFVYNVTYPTEKVGAFDVELAKEFLSAFATNGKFNLHINVPYGSNSHHIMEAVFKALARAMKKAVAVESEGGAIPSTKGVL